MKEERKEKENRKERECPGKRVWSVSRWVGPWV